MLPWWPLMPWLLALTPWSIRGERFMPLPLPFFPSQPQSIFAKVTKAICLTPSPNEHPHCQPLMRNGLPQRDCALRKASLLLFSCQAVPKSLQPHGVQHARLPCPSLSPGVYSNSCPLNWWCHPTISSSVTLFSSCPQSSPASTIILFKSRRFTVSQELRSFPCQSSRHNISIIFLFRWFKVVSTLPRALDIKPLLRRYH